MVKISVDTKITLDFGGISHELTKKEAKEIVRLLQKALEGDDGQRFGPVDIKKLFDREREKREEMPKNPYIPYEQPYIHPLIPHRLPWAEYTHITSLRG